MSHATYREYPEFRQCLNEIEAARNAAMEKIHRQVEADFNASREHGKPLPPLEEFERQYEQINTSYQQQVAEAHQRYGVPVLQSWEKALAETGCAVFHQEIHYYQGQCLQAMLMQEGSQTTLTLLETYRFPPEHYPTPDKIDHYLFTRGFYSETWEAKTLGQQENEREEDRVQRVLLTGTTPECLSEANDWLGYYLNSEDGELEPVSTAMSLIQRAQFLMQAEKDSTGQPERCEQLAPPSSGSQREVE